MTPQDFITKWGTPGGVPGPAYALNEEQGAQSHFLDLCELLGVPKPGSAEGYRFEEKSAVSGGKTGYADVFMRGVFAWENKAPGKNLDAALKQLLTYSLASVQCFTLIGAFSELPRGHLRCCMDFS